VIGADITLGWSRKWRRYAGPETQKWHEIRMTALRSHISDHGYRYAMQKPDFDGFARWSQIYVAGVANRPISETRPYKP
jgi:hypothetical protein